MLLNKALCHLFDWWEYQCAKGNDKRIKATITGIGGMIAVMMWLWWTLSEHPLPR